MSVACRGLDSSGIFCFGLLIQFHSGLLELKRTRRKTEILSDVVDVFTFMLKEST